MNLMESLSAHKYVSYGIHYMELKVVMVYANVLTPKPWNPLHGVERMDCQGYRFELYDVNPLHGVERYICFNDIHVTFLMNPLHGVESPRGLHMGDWHLN